MDPRQELRWLAKGRAPQLAGLGQCSIIQYMGARRCRVGKLVRDLIDLREADATRNRPMAASSCNTAKHCVGAATAYSVTGPYTPVGSSALICPLAQGGAIDAAGFYDNGKRYIVYKVDGSSIGHGGACNNDVAPYVPTPLILQPVGSDGVTLQGSATTILNHNGASDQGNLEAPSLTKVGSTYVLFFSSGCFVGSQYTVSYATSTSITGGYKRAASPLFATGVNGLSAPGGADIFRDGKHLLFHANSGGGRALYTAEVTISGTKVTV
ncbi:hypothetical protein LTR17_004099 [Elasticomyces elasticus]|nr:hypothetical protein LTR17_004099 [Elasticomyces elasticus]